jgi:hypothetical protein
VCERSAHVVRVAQMVVAALLYQRPPRPSLNPPQRPTHSNAFHPHLLQVQHRQVRQRMRHLAVLRAVGRLVDPQRALVERLGARVLSSLLEEGVKFRAAA